jgi:hypothetical protein
MAHGVLVVTLTAILVGHSGHLGGNWDNSMQILAHLHWVV